MKLYLLKLTIRVLYLYYIFRAHQKLEIKYENFHIKNTVCNIHNQRPSMTIKHNSKKVANPFNLFLLA